MRKLLLLLVLILIPAKAHGQATSIASGPTNPTTCASSGGQIFYNTTTGTYLSLTSANPCTWGTIGSGALGNGSLLDVTQAPYNMAPGSQIFGCTITSGSPNVSCPGFTFTSAMIGWLVDATNGCCGVGNQIGSVYSFNLNSSAENTIIGCSPSCPSTTAIISTNAAHNVSSGSSIVTIGPDATAGATAVTAALNSPTNTGAQCPPVVFGGGIYMVRQAEFNLNGNGCHLPVEGSGDTQAYFFGWGGLGSMIHPTQDFSFTSCTGGGSGKGCFFSGHGIHIQSLGINGGGASLTGGSHSNYLIELDNDSQMTLFTGSGFGASDTSLIGIYYAAGAESCPLIILDGFGGTAMELVSSVNAVVSQGFFGDVAGAPLNAVVYNSGATFNSVQNAYSIQGTSTFGLITGAGATREVNDAFGSSANSNVAVAYQSNSTGSLIGVSTTSMTGTSNAGLSLTSTAQVHITQSAFAGSLKAIGTASGTSLWDDCGNVIIPDNATLTINGNLFGSCSITGTVQTSANWSVPAGSSAGQWGTSPSVGSCAVNGDSRTDICTITIGSGTVGSSPALTVTFPSGGAASAFWVAPMCSAQMIGGTAAWSNFITGTVSTTSAVFTYNGTPGASDTIILKVSCL
jgi:hypothetical protein